MSEEEKWKMEAIWLAPDFYLHSIEQVAFIKGYLQACKVRQEEGRKEIERLKDIIKQRNISLTVYEENR